MKSIEQNIREILVQIGEDPERTGIKDTPKRIARMYEEVFKGYKEDNLKLTSFPNNDDGITYDQIIFDKGYFYSFCEHHMVPFFGEYAIGYIPDKKVIGLSKIGRIVDHYSSRMQVQERLTQQVLDRLEEVLKPQGVIVTIKARHLCRELRGIHKQGAVMGTSAISGVFKKPEVRAEFLSLISA
jgi:GTP cyclohydrolase IA